MKTFKVYARTILARTGFKNKKYAFKEETQIIAFLGKKEIFSNCYERIDNKQLKKPFELKLETRSIKKLEKIVERKDQTNVGKWFKEEITKVIENNK